VFSIDELVALPIVGEPAEVRVGELALRPAGVVRVLMPGHATHPSIVHLVLLTMDSDAVLGAKSVPRDFPRQFENGVARDCSS
jgi:hypothetical protein